MRNTALAMVLAPLAFAIINAGGRLALIGLVLPLPGASLQLTFYLLLGSVVLSARAAYLGTVALGFPGYLIVCRLRRSGWRAYAVLGAGLGLATGLADAWYSVASAAGPARAWAALLTAWWHLAALPGAVAMVAGAVEGIVFRAIARPAARPPGRWAQVMLLVPALAVWAALLLPIARHVAEAMRDAHPVDALASVEHPLWNAGVYPGQFPAIFYWVDDDTILFRGGAGPKPRDFGEARNRTDALYVWRLGAAPRRAVAEFRSGVDRYCAADGRLGYSITEGPLQPGQGHTRFLAGRLGEEHEVAAEPASPLPVAARGNAQNDPRRIAPGDCRPVADPAMAGRVWIADTSRDYRLDFGPVGLGRAASDPVTLMRADGTGRVALPIAARDVMARCTHFHGFDGAFLIWDCNNIGQHTDSLMRWQATGNCWPIWRVQAASAAVETLCLPFGDWVGDTIELVPTKAGLLFTASRAPPYAPHDWGAAGLYELGDGHPRRILAGFIDGPVVSPGGCRVVFTYSRDHAANVFGEPGSPTVVALDLCETRRVDR